MASWGLDQGSASCLGLGCGHRGDGDGAGVGGKQRGPEEGAGMGEWELMSRHAWGRGTKVYKGF